VIKIKVTAKRAIGIQIPNLRKALEVMCKPNPTMRKLFFILTITLSSRATHAQYIYRGKVISAIRQQPIIFGTVRLPSRLGVGYDGKELAKIDSLGNFTVKLKDTTNVRFVIDCILAGSTMQRVYYTDTVIVFSITTDCYDYNVEKAKRDIDSNRILLLCDLGYAIYKFTDKDRAFKKKYGITYYTFADTPIMSDCMWLYNKTIAGYLDDKFGKEWRKEVRWDVDFY